MAQTVTEKQIVIVGNPVDGFRFYGPFDYHDDAVRYCEQTVEGDWWVTTLDPPFSK